MLAYLGHPYLTEDDGYNPEYEGIWHGFDALDSRNGVSEEYGRPQTEHVLGKLGEIVTEFIAEGGKEQDGQDRREGRRGRCRPRRRCGGS